MKIYIYPENLKANVKLWLWNVRDFIIICTAIVFMEENLNDKEQKQRSGLDRS